ncbi:conjugal transfer protein TraG N-terminal domain-containing protein [Desulfurobacterium crinifex]
MAWEVFTFGNGDVLTQIIMAVKGVMDDVGYKGLITLVITLSLFVSFWHALWEGNNFSIPWKTWIAGVLIVGILYTPRVDVIVRDEIKNTQTLVENVPWGLGAFASFFTSIQKNLAKKFDQFFSLPDDLKFTNSGYAFVWSKEKDEK